MQPKRQIIFVHGIMGSTLKKDSTFNVWPKIIYRSKRYDILTEYLEASDRDIKAIKPLFTYKKIIKFLGEISDEYRSFVYDWRKNNMHHLEELYRSLSNTAEEIIIVAHSMGGVLSKLMLNKYAGFDNVKKVTKLITIGTPWNGSIDAYKTLQFGKEIPEKKYLPRVLLKHEAKKISKYFPSIYQLLPTNNYFSEISHSLGDSYKAFKIKNIEYTNFEEFYRTVLEENFNENHKNKYNEVFEDFKQLLNNPIPQHIEHHEFIGVGIPTMASIIVDHLNEYDTVWYEGDGTVALFSATSDTSYKYYVGETDHVSLTGKVAVHNAIHNIICGQEVENNPDVFKELEEPYYSGFNAEIIKVACPVEVAVLNNEGDTIAGSLDDIDEETYEVIKELNNIRYEELGSTKYIILDNDLQNENTEDKIKDELINKNVNAIRIQATDKGPTSVTIESYKNAKLDLKKAFRTFEISPEKEAILNIDENIICSNLEVFSEKEESYKIDSVIVNEKDVKLPQTSLKIHNKEKVILNKKDGKKVYVIKDNLLLGITSVQSESQKIDQTFVKWNDEVYLLEDSLELELNEGINEIIYFSKDLMGNLEEEHYLYVYKIPKCVYELKLEFTPSYYVIELNFTKVYDDLLYEYDKKLESNLKWKISDSKNTIGNWIAYEEKTKKLEVNYTDLFSNNIKKEYIIDEKLIGDIINGKVEDEEFRKLLGNLNVSLEKVKMKSGSANRLKNITTSNLRNAQEITFEEDELVFLLKKYLKYNLFWINLSETVSLENTDKLKLEFTLLDNEHKEIENIDLKCEINYELKEEKVSSNLFDINFDKAKKVYYLIIDFEELNISDSDTESFEINIYESGQGNSIRIQEIVIRK